MTVPSIAEEGIQIVRAVVAISLIAGANVSLSERVQIDAVKLRRISEPIRTGRAEVCLRLKVVVRHTPLAIRVIELRGKMVLEDVVFNQKIGCDLDANSVGVARVPIKVRITHCAMITN